MFTEEHMQSLMKQLDLAVLPQDDVVEESEESLKYEKLQKSAERLKSNKDYITLKKHFQELYILSFKNYPGTQEGVNEAFANMHFRRGLNLFFDIIG